MILEGFEIENWNCIKKVNVSGLPPTGVIVLHGPNRRGKSSIVRALRACLMDYASTTTALKSHYPKGTGEKPVVSVSFRVGGTGYRIRKHFGSNKSDLASKTSTGDWKVETTTAADAHERTCDLVGGNDSNKGLHQLLWLTQAEFHLPEPKKFDASVQAQLRGILGVLQTPLDDRFIERVRKRWDLWFSGQRKPGKEHKLKSGCKLAENLAKLEAGQKELRDSDGRFNDVEELIAQSDRLEQQKRDLDRQFNQASDELNERQGERQRSQVRILARQQAEKDHAAAKKEREDALQEKLERAKAADRLSQDESAIALAQKHVDESQQSVQLMESTLNDRRKELDKQRGQRRESQNRANRVADRIGALRNAEYRTIAEAELNRAQAIANDIAEIEKYLSEHPAPDEASLKALKANREQSSQLRADLNAASINLTLIPESSASSAQLAVDGSPFRDLPLSQAPILHSVQRKADLLISGWGRVELNRGTSSGDLDQIENELRQCNEEFANAIAPLGISASDPRALDLLLQRTAEHAVTNPKLVKLKKELKKLAPKGLEPLETKVKELQTKLTNVPATDPMDAKPLPSDLGDLELLTKNLQQQLARIEKAIESLEQAEKEAETELVNARKKETGDREMLAGCKARANSSREALELMPTEEQIAQRLDAANGAAAEAAAKLKQTELTHAEQTIDERLEAAVQAVSALQRQIEDNTRNYHEIKGRLKASEGLHAQRSSLAARVDELARLSERESLEKDSIDRLYALFEECREKQLGKLMGPIHDRVLSWMRVLEIGDYKEVRFNDAFLPDKLMSRDGTAEFTMDEESTGAQEQIGMLVRLALGSTLAKSDEPAVAVLDDPLTHCDIGRLNKMRVILRRAAEGDPNLSPPAGPLQIFILTCHPEWFRDERATVIDLENPAVMSRFPV